MVLALRLAFRGQTVPSYPMGAAMVVGSGVVFSFTPLLFRAVDRATDWQFLTVRGAGTALAAALIMIARRRHRPVQRAAFNWQTLVASLLMASMSSLYILALARTSTALIAFLQSAGPFSGALFGWLLLREPVQARTWLAMAVASVGIAIMVGGGFEAGSVAGVLLALAIPGVLGLYNVMIKLAPEKDPVVPPLVGGTVLSVVAATMAVVGDGLAMSVRDAGIGFAAGLVLLGIGLPMFNLGHVAVPAAQIPLLLMAEIVLAPLWVWIWPGEVPRSQTIIGGAIVLSAVFFLAAAGLRGRRFWPARR